MAPATDAEPQRIASGCTSDHSAKMTPPQQAELEFRQQTRSEGAQDVAPGGWRLAQDTTMGELQDTRGGSSESGGGPEMECGGYLGGSQSSDSEDWSLRPAGPAQPAEPRHSPVRRGTPDEHGWLGRRQ